MKYTEFADIQSPNGLGFRFSIPSSNNWITLCGTSQFLPKIKGFWDRLATNEHTMVLLKPHPFPQITSDKGSTFPLWRMHPYASLYFTSKLAIVTCNTGKLSRMTTNPSWCQGSNSQNFRGFWRYFAGARLLSNFHPVFLSGRYPSFERGNSMEFSWNSNPPEKSPRVSLSHEARRSPSWQHQKACISFPTLTCWLQLG